MSVVLNLEETPYIYTIDNVALHFSRELVYQRFTSRIEEDLLIIKRRLRRVLGDDYIISKRLLCILIYKERERNGFLVKVSGVPYNSFSALGKIAVSINGL